jgi:UDP-glucose 4-epimerase
MVLPTFVRQALQGDPLTVYGTGEQMRSFLHVADAVRAVQGLSDREDAVGQVFNIGREEEVSMLDLAARVIERTGSSSAVRLVPYDEAYGDGFEDMERRQPDARKLQAFLPWSPDRALDEMIDQVADDIRARL